MNPTSTARIPRVLVAPLDWGLGHATRCIPIIYALLARNAEVILAGEGPVATLLKTEFPQLLFLPLPGYRVRYGNTKGRTLAALVRQLPKLLRAIKTEHAWLQQVVYTHKIDAVISDNRYGLHHPQIYSVFITHQLLVKTYTRPAEALLQKWLYRYINRFDACWVPDNESAPNFAGDLSHPHIRPHTPLTYLGPVSRFAPAACTLTHYILILLSGPEPQRTLLEEKLLEQIKVFQNPILFVRGLPGHTGLPAVPYPVTIVNHLPTAALQKAIAGAHYVISRCGYSTVMDLMTLQKKCIFIPTPGQTEQEYLGRHLGDQNFALCIPQQKFKLPQAIALAETFPYQLPPVEKTQALHNAVETLLQQV